MTQDFGPSPSGDSTRRSAAEEKFARAQARWREGAFAEALILLDELDQAFPGRANLLRPKAMCLAKLGLTDQARAICLRLLREGDDPRAQELLQGLDAQDRQQKPSSGLRRSRALQGGALAAILLLLGLVFTFFTLRRGDERIGRQDSAATGASATTEAPVITPATPAEPFRTPLPSPAPSAGTIVIPLEYTVHSDGDDKSYQPIGYTTLTKMRHATSSFGRLPQLTGRAPVFAVSRLGGHEYGFILDRHREEDPFYNRLYFDANANGDLTDDPVVEGRITESSSGKTQTARFPAIDLTMKIGGQRFPFRFKARAQCYFSGRPKNMTIEKNWDDLQFLLQSHCLHKGTLNLGGTRHTFWLQDANCNGRFSDCIATEPGYTYAKGIEGSGDKLYLADTTTPGEYDGIWLTEGIVLGDLYHRMQVDLRQGHVTLTPVTGDAVAPLSIDGSTERLVLRSLTGGDSLMLYRPAGTVQVPPGEYGLLEYTAKKGEGGGFWALRAAATSKSRTVTVTRGGESTLRFGEPYVPSVSLAGSSLSERARREGEVRIEFAVHGQGAERVRNLKLLGSRSFGVQVSRKSKTLPVEPAYKIVTSDGEVVTQGTFEYG